MQVSLVAVAPRDNKRPSTYLFTLVLLFIFFPGLSYFWLADKQLSYASALWLCGLVMVFLLRAIKVAPISWRPVPKGNSTDAAKSFLMLIFIGYIGGSLLIIAIRGGIDPRAFSFDQIYQLRAENSLSGATAYFYNAATKALFPFFLGYFLTRKRSKLWRYTFAAIVVIFQLIYYLSFGFKAFLFSVFFAMLIVFALYWRKFITVVVGGISAVVLSSVLSSSLLVFEMARDTVAFRTLMHPAQIQYIYHEWFMKNEYLYFAETSVGKLLGLQSDYAEGITYRIGSTFAGNTNVNAVTGIFSDAFANGGIVLMVLTAIVAGVMLVMADFLGTRSPILTVVALSYFVFTLNDTPLTTALVTGGYLIILFLLFIERKTVPAIEQK